MPPGARGDFDCASPVLGDSEVAALTATLDRVQADPDAPDVVIAGHYLDLQNAAAAIFNGTCEQELADACAQLPIQCRVELRDGEAIGGTLDQVFERVALESTRGELEVIVREW